MPGWSGSDRRKRLPANWEREIRPRILARDEHRCRYTEHGERCISRATDVDHIVHGDDHRDSNLQSLCAFHHSEKSAQEGGAALAAKRDKINKKFRRREDHVSSW